ncbi:MAG: cytochrome c3 family protein, partial [Ignavibacteriaceae bacterium]
DHFRSTGWALKSYHAKLTCQKCHGTKIPYTKIDRNCVSCHKEWNADNFKHEVTGLKLDELHESFDCADCHADNNYSIKPTCDNCHEDFVYPKVLPGKLLRK